MAATRHGWDKAASCGRTPKKTGYDTFLSGIILNSPRFPVI
jgi:hypothetical protein